MGWTLKDYQGRYWIESGKGKYAVQIATVNAVETEVAGEIEADHKATIARGNLLAAAPDLLAVARMAMQPERDSHDQHHAWRERLKKAAADAIAKATG